MTLVDVGDVKVAGEKIVVGIVGIGTAVPPAVRQADAITLAELMACEDDRQRAWLRRVFGRCGVESRGSVLISGDGEPLADLKRFYEVSGKAGDRGPTTAKRMEIYAQTCPLLAEKASKSALFDAQITPKNVTHLVTVSCTGFSAPGMDSELIERLGLRADVARTHIGFMGCHAAFNALGVAQGIVRGESEAVVLVVCVEICSLHFSYGWAPEKLVANALFGDGAAAAVVGRVGEGGVQREGMGWWELKRRASLFLAGSKGAMTWRIGDFGFEMTLSPELPGMVEGRVREWCEGWLGEEGVGVGEVDLWAVHPGGPKVLVAVREGLGLEEGDLRFSRKVLAEHGNMSSTTVLFVLEEMARAGMEGRCVGLGFGPGLMMEGVLLERRMAKFG